MHRRGVVLLFGFLVAIVVVGGSGVRTPWNPSSERPAAPAGPFVGGPQIAVGATRMRME